MIRQTTMLLAVLAVAAVLLTGCWPFSDKAKSEKKAAAQPAPAADERVVKPYRTAQAAAAKKGGQPDEVDLLLADLDSPTLVLQWRAEQALRDMGPSIAARVRPLLGSTAILPEARAAACRLAEQFRDAQAIPAMIALLMDDSRLVRSMANVSLCGLTNQDFDYRPDAIAEDRAAAQARWQAWHLRTAGPILPPKRH
jgi:HEAT repeat protein